MVQNPLSEANSNSVKKFSTVYLTRRFITVFVRASHWSLSWSRCFQSTPSHGTSPRFILTSSSHLYLCLPSGLFPSYFPTKNFVCTSHLSHACYMPTHIILLQYRG